MSVLLPAICFLMKGKNVWMNVACIAGVYVLGAHLPVPELVDTFTFGVAFMLGALISLYHGELKGYYGRLSGLKKWAVLAVGLAGYYAGVLPVLQRHKADTASTAIGSCVLILFALNSTLASRILRHAVPEYLGRISYSLYLVHGTVLFALLNLLYGRVSNAGLFVIYLGVATALAHLFCLCVEEPTMRLGKRLSEHLR